MEIIIKKIEIKHLSIWLIVVLLLSVQFVFGNNPLHEWKFPVTERPTKETDEVTGIVRKVGTEPTENITTWIFDEGTFVPTAKITGEENFSIVSDHLGTPVEMYDKYGIKVWEYLLFI